MELGLCHTVFARWRERVVVLSMVQRGKNGSTRQGPTFSLRWLATEPGGAFVVSGGYTRSTV